MSVFFFGFYFLSVFLAGVAYGFEDYLSPNWELNFCWPRCPLILQELKTNLGGEVLVMCMAFCLARNSWWFQMLF